MRGLSGDGDSGWVMASWLIDSFFSQLQSGPGPNIWGVAHWTTAALSSPTLFQKQKYFIHTSKIFETFRSSRIRLYISLRPNLQSFSKNSLKDTRIMSTLIIRKWDCHKKTNIINDFLFPAPLNTYLITEDTTKEIWQKQIR